MNYNELFTKDGLISGEIEIHFNDIEKVLAKKILKYDAVVGCGTWITNDILIQAMTSRPNGICIIIDKNGVSKTGFSKIRKIKKSIPLSFYLKSIIYDCFINIAPSLKNEDQRNTDSLRVFGAEMETKGQYPRLHHKFLVFCKVDEKGDISPVEVATGSYNFTENANLCRENVVILKNFQQASVFYGEWARCYFASSPHNPSGIKKNSPYNEIDNLEDIIELAKEDQRIYDSAIDQEINKLDHGGYGD